MRPRATLAVVGVRPTKSRGQNFLVQAGIANRIVDAAALGPLDLVIEIGPGLGILSERIAAHPISRLTLVEIDSRLAARLQDRFAGDRRVRVINADFLELDFASFDGGSPLKLIGNLPFNAASAILTRLCGHRSVISRMVLMFQREVAERIRASLGTSAYGALTVFTSLYFKVTSHFRVPAGNFHPRPKIDAEVLVFEPHAKTPFSPDEEALVLATIRAAFSAPRKTMRNSISHALNSNVTLIEESLLRASIDPGARAETLDTPAFVRLARQLQPVITASNA